MIWRHKQSLVPDPVIVGDFNIDVGKSSSKVVNYKSFLSSFNLTQHIDFFTHLKGGILDHIITPNHSNLLYAVRISDCMSGHMCLLARFNCGTDAVVPDTQISFRQYQKIDMPKFKHELLSLSS